MRSQSIWAAIAIAVNSVAASSSASLEVFETLHTVPQGWTQRGKPDASSRMRLRIALKMPDHDLFEQTLYSISTPDHPTYGQHLNHEELRALVDPKDESVDSVLSWLESSGVPDTDIEYSNEWIKFTVSVADAESMLDTTFNYFTQDVDNSQTEKLRTLSVSLPADVLPHVSMIQPTTRFGMMQAQRAAPFSMTKLDETVYTPSVTSATTDLATLCNYISPDCLRELYSVGNYSANPDAGSLFGVCGYLDEYAKYDALEDFQSVYAPWGASQNFSFVLINGGLSTQDDDVDDDVEANLDIQYATSIGYGQDITYYSTGGLGELVPDLDQPDADDGDNEPYLEFLNYILALDDSELPQTITTSYGEDEQSVPASYATTACDLFGQLGLRGVSILFSSGDTGVGSACQTNDGLNTTRFLPIFPAACPYVTSVGGTFGVEPEAAVSFSSGGFSDLFPRPSYQDAAVAAYLEILGDQWDGLYNKTGRGFPDVSAQGYDFLVTEPGNITYLVGGTSASAPTFAAIISLLNNARLSVGQAPLGFLNPWLYSVGVEGLTDIVDGGSDGCTGTDIYSGLPTPYVPYASWNATTGWDPVTGLGTPNFELLLNLTTPVNNLSRITL